MPRYVPEFLIVMVVCLLFALLHTERQPQTSSKRKPFRYSLQEIDHWQNSNKVDNVGIGFLESRVKEILGEPVAQEQGNDYKLFKYSRGTGVRFSQNRATDIIGTELTQESETAIAAFDSKLDVRNALRFLRPLPEEAGMQPIYRAPNWPPMLDSGDNYDARWASDIGEVEPMSRDDFLPFFIVVFYKHDRVARIQLSVQRTPRRNSQRSTGRGGK